MIFETKRLRLRRGLSAKVWNFVWRHSIGYNTENMAYCCFDNIAVVLLCLVSNSIHIRGVTMGDKPQEV